MHRLSTLDSGFLITESHHSPKHVGGLQILRLPKGKSTAWLRRLLDDLKQVPPQFPFNRKLKDQSALQPVLVTDENFDIDYHVRHTVLPGPGSDAQLEEMISRLHANLLDRERPLWEFHLIEGLSGRRFAFYTKIHHAIVDGITFARWFAESGSPSASDMDAHPIWHRDETPAEAGDDSNLVELMFDTVKMLGGGVKTSAELLALSARLIQKNIFEGNRNAVLPLSAKKNTPECPDRRRQELQHL